ncbi:MAG: ATP-binding protein [Candidatus Aenigmarchaeota archaeon]|nr:ATP-binding protein [Candidatus Aenigmarchaeota archaeon]
MNELSIVGQVVRGDFAEVVVRQKSGEEIEIGDLLVADTTNGYIILEAFDLAYGSQIGELSRELISGMALEGYERAPLYDEAMANYTIARLKPLVLVANGRERIPKVLPKFFSHIRQVTPQDLAFLAKPANPLYVGTVRSGSKELGVDVTLDGRKVLTHHVLVAATTGRGKSNLVKVLASSITQGGYCSLLIFDPHDEYTSALPQCVSYSVKPKLGGCSLVFSLDALKPQHLEDLSSFTDAQQQALSAYYKEHGDSWIRELVLSTKNEADRFGIHPGTLAAVQRKFNVLLGIRAVNGALQCEGIFSETSGKTTLADICRELESGTSVIINTSLISGELEVIASSMIAKEAFSRYKKCKIDGTLEKKPIISVVLEEAPRVLNKDALEKGNIFATIAREGRKFNVGLLAITQLPGLIPKEILANLNTKIILGTELASERNAVIESAAQDLSRDDRNIASLDVGEAIITSNFTRFAVPVKIPLFRKQEKPQEKIRFSGMG